jgi:hypothetical protein
MSSMNATAGAAGFPTTIDASSEATSAPTAPRRRKPVTLGPPCMEMPASARGRRPTREAVRPVGPAPARERSEWSSGPSSASLQAQRASTGARREQIGGSMYPGGFRIDPTRVPGPIAAMFIAANAALRGAWTLSERLREVIRLYSAFEHECHT